ncbi:MAG: peptidyl-prolyl cis-trans isomerase [Planctomycetota bacterium]|jgi:hypothetical protein
MRALLPLFLLLGLGGPAAFAQAQKHDALGFPITFNNERITRNDVLRDIGATERTVTPGTLAAAREKVLMDKLTERIGELWGIMVPEIEIKSEVRARVELLGGETAFYDWLRQRGQTYAQFEEDIRQRNLRRLVEVLLRQGIAYGPSQRILPWSTRPSPADVRVAFKNDKSREERKGGRARAIVLTIELDPQEKMKIAESISDDDERDFLEVIAERAKARAADLHAALKKGRKLEDVAKALGIENLAEQRKQWRDLPDEPAPDPIGRFLQTAKDKTYSGPIEEAAGVYALVYLVERQQLSQRGLDDTEVFDEYFRKIVDLRRDKAEALIRIAALDRSRLRPESVRKNFRDFLVADLRAAVEDLRALGLR